MKQANYGAAENFSLPKGNGQHDFYSLSEILYRKCRSCKPEKHDNPPYGVGKYTQGNDQSYSKDYLFCHIDFLRFTPTPREAKKINLLPMGLG
jgi:hypothetical protein